jgi:hypothetical protein
MEIYFVILNNSIFELQKRFLFKQTGIFSLYKPLSDPDSGFVMVE